MFQAISLGIMTLIYLQIRNLIDIFPLQQPPHSGHSYAQDATVQRYQNVLRKVSTHSIVDGEGAADGDSGWEEDEGGEVQLKKPDVGPLIEDLRVSSRR
jgi:hypothetical protein